ncbi:hypothetical protein M2277_005146 [Paenibacillus sp. LBL]|uniref:hypothetical protein n=1 Tax=Paenibacillus sp. LBL TaxID=2940563 RepID=UPI002475C73D|nr:hypothetical protein [Paenibacillus sp. LBL]MDH6674450.1 hypothetical protein [Paenibacillus sp. LBL]
MQQEREHKGLADVELKFNVQFAGWYEVLIQKMGGALQDAVDAGMPVDLADNMFKGSLSSVLRDALVIGDRDGWEQSGK